MPAGRPAWQPTQEAIDKVMNLSAAKCTIEEICATLGISKTTLYKYKELDEEFSNAISMGQQKGHAFAKSKLMELIRAGNPSAIMFYLKTQCGWKEKVELSGSIEIAPVIAPAIVSKDEWNKLTQNPDALSLGPHKPDPKQPS